MRKGIVLLVLIVILTFLGYRLLTKKPGARPKSKTKTTETTEGKRKETARRAGRRAGRLEEREKKSREEKRKARELRKEERRRRREERKRLREERRRMRLAEGMRRAKGRRGRKRATLYVLQAIVRVGDQEFAMIDGKQYKVGDEIKGRRIVKIEQDKITLDYHGELTTVRVGESCVPLATLPKRERRR